MRKLVLALAAGAMALAGGATSANAASVVTGVLPSSVLTPPDSALFGAKITGGAQSFDDTFTFNIIGGGVADAQVTTLLLNGAQNINFTSIMVDSLYAFVKTSTDPNPETWMLEPVLLADGAHSIRVMGNLLGQNGTYSGTINVAAVPEPATWAMMLIGFGGIGFAMRRRKQPVLAQVA